MGKRFNIRVYGLLINENKEILVADECRLGNFFTKFPGGGLEWGEGIIDCLKREFMEELNISITVKDHFYTTDFFQQSAFNQNDQLISIYYFVEYLKTKELKFEHYSVPFNTETEKFRWIKIAAFNESELTFPIDKIVLQQLKQIID